MVENLRTTSNGPIVWPLLMDYTKDDCDQMLRSLELEAYSKVISVFRAQGPLTTEKRKTLEDLQHLLSIATDRHKAEIRRALNDEQLATIAESICGKETSEDWAIEARRIAPLLLRSTPKTAFLAQADSIAAKWAAINHSVPRLSAPEVTLKKRTTKREWIAMESSNELGRVLSENQPEGLDEHECITDETLAQVHVSKTNDVVPEAAVEVTCKADTQKTVHTPFKFVEKTSLVSSIYVKHDNRISNEQVISSASKIDVDCESHENICLIHPAQHIVTTPIINPSSNISGARIITPQQIPPAANTDNSTHLNNGVVPLISQSRNVFIRQNVVPSSIGLPHGSQGIQAQKSNSVGSPVSVASVGSLSHIAPATFTGAKPTLTGITTVVVTGSSGVSAYVSGQTTNASSPAGTRIMKNYSSVMNYNSSPTATTHLSASSILADSKKQHLQQQPSLLHHSAMLQQPQSAAAAAGNVFVVHRGGSNHLMTSGSAVAAAAQITYTPSSVAAVSRFPIGSTVTTPTSATISPSKRPVRILSVPISSIAPPSSGHTTNVLCGNSATLSPILPTNQRSFSQQHYRVTNTTGNIGTTRSDSDLTVSPSGSLKIIKMPLSANHAAPATTFLRSTTPVVGAAPATVNAPSSAQSASPALVSILEPKKPRIAFVAPPPASGATASPSASQ